MVRTYEKLCARQECATKFTALDSRKRFCSQNCSAIVSNQSRAKLGKACGNPSCNKLTKNPKYCSVACANDVIGKASLSFILDDWIAGKVPAQNKKGELLATAKRYLYNAANWTCECGWNTPNPVLGRPILAVDHVDGNHRNNYISNLKVLCYNCHTLTPNFGALNKGRTVSPRSVYSRKKYLV